MNLYTSILVYSKPQHVVDVDIADRENIGNSLETDDSLTTAISKFEMKMQFLVGEVVALAKTLTPWVCCSFGNNLILLLDFQFHAAVWCSLCDLC